MENKIMISGFGGQGVMLIGQLLGYTAKDVDKKSTFYPAYGPEQRGGTANCTIVISDNEIGSPVPTKIDTLMALNQPSIDKYLDKIKSGGTLIINSNHVKQKVDRNDISIYEVPADDLARELGFAKAANMVMLGAYAEANNILTQEQILSTLKVQLARKAEFFDLNKAAIVKGSETIKNQVGEGF